MKQNYIKPEMETLKFAAEVLMNVTSGETDGTGIGDGSTNDDDPDLTNYRRGVWGKPVGESIGIGVYLHLVADEWP